MARHETSSLDLELMLFGVIFARANVFKYVDNHVGTCRDGKIGAKGTKFKSKWWQRA